jgi:hypothetical protein
VRTAGGFFDRREVLSLFGERRRTRSIWASAPDIRAPIVSAAAPASMITFLRILCLLEHWRSALQG